MSNELVLNVESYLENVLNRFVSGSNLIRVSDLLNEADFKLSFEWSQGLSKGEGSNLLDELLIDLYGKTNFHSIRSIKKLILADPGVGKSTLCYLIFNRVFIELKNNSSRVCPIYIDLEEYIGDKTFGTKDWVANYLDSFSGKSNISWVTNFEGGDSFKIIPFYILDSLDEYLANCTLSEIQIELNKYIFKESNIVSCRTQFYEYYISSSNRAFVKNFHTIIINKWSESYQQTYAKWYFNKFFKKNNQTIQVFLREILNSWDLFELCKVPIRYNMILEILAKNDMNFNLVERLISIYHNYTIMTIKHESSRVGSILSIDEKMFYLKILAWNFYDERKIGNAFEKIRFSTSTMKEVLSKELEIIARYDLDAVIRDLIKCSVLIEDTNNEFEVSYSCVKFSHKSIQEFFVARYIYEEIISRKTFNGLSSIFRNFISQEIDIFLKDYFENLNKDLDLLDIASINLISSYKENVPLDEDDTNIINRKRIARNQIGYTLGHLKSKMINQFLDETIEKEEDEFIKRSIIIGLSIGGRKNILDDYIEKLRSDPYNESNIINIGFQLSYFGDQPFDILQPYIDQKLPKCNNVVSKLIRALGVPTNRGALRIDLYTLIYLSKYRSISSNDFWSTLKENFSQFKYVIKNIAKESELSNYPEVQEALEIIKQIENV